MAVIPLRHCKSSSSLSKRLRLLGGSVSTTILADASKFAARPAAMGVAQDVPERYFAGREPAPGSHTGTASPKAWKILEYSSQDGLKEDGKPLPSVELIPKTSSARAGHAMFIFAPSFRVAAKNKGGFGLREASSMAWRIIGIVLVNPKLMTMISTFHESVAFRIAYRYPFVLVSDMIEEGNKGLL